MEISHKPFGQEHPYEQLPEERFPRRPLAGEPFTIGIATRPPGAAHTVIVHTQINGAAGPSVTATSDPDWQPRLEDGVGAEFLDRMVKIDQDIWRANLIAPAVGQNLTYWIEAVGQRSPEFSLRGSAWQPLKRDVTLTLDNDADSPRWTMQIGNQAAGTTSNNTGGKTPASNALPALRLVEGLTDGKHISRLRLTFTCAPDEAFFGLGERFNALDQRGEVLDVRCYEQYKSQGKRTYMPMPFLLSSAGYGVYVESARWMQFDLAASQPEVWVLEAELGPDETLQLTWFEGDDPLKIIGAFSRLTGPAVLPPTWAFGLWMSANEWNSQQRVIHEVEQSFTHEIVPSVLVIEAWSDETTFYVWNDAQYPPTPGDAAPHYSDFTFPAEGKWPNPKEMVDWLHERDIRLLLWQVPVFKASDGQNPQHEADRAIFEQQGYGVHEADGSLYTVKPFWFRDGYLWDVTNPEARAWWLQKRAYLLEDIGIDGFKTDGGEHLWGRHTRFSDGRQGDELWNAYPQLYTEAYYQFATEKRNGDALTFSRAGFAGSQRSPVHWAGDENSTWDAFRHSILAGLSAGVSGIPFWGWDLGGFSGEIPSAELYLRGAAMAAFCPIMQYHAEYNQHREPSHDRTPWNIQERTGDERVIPAFRFLVNARHNLMPYIWQEAQHAVQTGLPMMRALALWEKEASPYQYFFGRDLLVCPVVEEGAHEWPITLPDGGWCDLWTGERFVGGQTVHVDAPLDRIPVFVRAGSTIPIAWGPNQQWGELVPLTITANATLRFA